MAIPLPPLHVVADTVRKKKRHLSCHHPPPWWLEALSTGGVRSEWSWCRVVRSGSDVSNVVVAIDVAVVVVTLFCFSFVVLRWGGCRGRGCCRVVRGSRSVYVCVCGLVLVLVFVSLVSVCLGGLVGTS